MANPPEAWVRKPGAFTPVVPVEWFYTAQGIIQARSRRQSDTELLDRLKQLYQERGFLSGILIDETEGMASSSVYASRFGGLGSVEIWDSQLGLFVIQALDGSLCID